MKTHYYNKEEEITIFHNNLNKNVYRHSSQQDIQTQYRIIEVSLLSRRSIHSMHVCTICEPLYQLLKITFKETK